jgi:serine/threonine protein kinase
MAFTSNSQILDTPESDDYLRTYCGTQLYIAPEVFKRKPYDAVVDIWSLGVVVYQYARGLPNLDLRRGFDGPRWTKTIIQALETDAEGLCCPLLTFLWRA